MFVFNNTKVIPARLFGRRKETGGKVEALLLTPKGNDVWEILVNPGRKALPGQEIEFSENFSCTVIDKTEFGGRLVKFHYSGDFDNWLDQLGEMPTPPYIHKSWRIKMNTRRYMRSLRALPPHRQQDFILLLSFWKNERQRGRTSFCDTPRGNRNFSTSCGREY